MPTDKDEFTYGLLKESYAEEIERRKELDGKSSSLMAYVSIIIGLTIDLGTSSFKDTKPISEYHPLFFVGVSFLITAVIFALVSLLLRKWTVVPNIGALMKDNDDPIIDTGSIIDSQIAELIPAITNNRKKNDSKAKLIIVSWGFLVAGLVTLVYFLVILSTNMS